MKDYQIKISLFITILSFLSLAINGQQIADPNFDAKAANPAYVKKHPKVLFDEAHNNFHTAAGRYKPFADLMASDGYIITSNKEKFQQRTLAGYDILIIANALGAERQNMPEAGSPAFTDEECDAVRDWVRAGGALLLIADHAPFGSAAEILARRFEIEMSKGHTRDTANFDPETGNTSFIIFSKDKGSLGDHAILRGRNAAEKISKILTFTGQSLKGPANSVLLLKLAETARDISQPGEEGASAAGRAQGLAIKFGKGRVVALGEAAMLSAQIATLGQKEIKMGMNRAGNDDRQFALNIMHWLSKLLK